MINARQHDINMNNIFPYIEKGTMRILKGHNRNGQ